MPMYVSELQTLHGCGKEGLKRGGGGRDLLSNYNEWNV